MRESLRYLARDLWRLRQAPPFDALQLPPLPWLGVARPAFVERAHALGLAVHYWTVDSSSDMRRLAATGADGLMTNRPKRLSTVIEALALEKSSDSPDEIAPARPGGDAVASPLDDDSARWTPSNSTGMVPDRM